MLRYHHTVLDVSGSAKGHISAFKAEAALLGRTKTSGRPDQTSQSEVTVFGSTKRPITQRTAAANRNPTRRNSLRSLPRTASRHSAAGARAALGNEAVVHCFLPSRRASNSQHA